MNRQFLLLASLRFVKLSLTVVVLMVYARAFGIGFQMDSWVFASGVVASVGLALWGPVNEIVRSRFVRQVTDMGEDGARRSATSLLVFTSIASVLVCVVLFVGAPKIVEILYTASEPAASALVQQLFFLMLPSIVIGQALSLGTAYMNCYGVIYVPEYLGIATAVLNLTCVLVLTPLLGIYSLVCGYYLGATASLVVILRFLWSRGFLRGIAGARVVFRDARAVILFGAPLFLAYGAGQLNGLLEKYLASLMGAGVLSSINYAAQIKSTLQAALTSVMFSLIVPQLTHAASQRGGDVFKRLLAESQRLAMVFLLIVLPFVFGTADALAAILFGKGSTSASALQEIALLIRLYIAALVPVVLYLVYGVALLAQQKGRAYAALGVAAQLLSALICVALFQKLGPTVFPIALLLSHLTVAVLMLRRIDFQNRPTLLGEAAAFVGVLAAAAGVVLMAFRALSNTFHSGLPSLSLFGLAYGLIILVLFYVSRGRGISK